MENEMLDFVKALSHADRLRIIGALTTRKGDGSQYWRPEPADLKPMSEAPQ